MDTLTPQDLIVDWPSDRALPNLGDTFQVPLGGCMEGDIAVVSGVQTGSLMGRPFQRVRIQFHFTITKSVGLAPLPRVMGKIVTKGHEG